MSERITNRDRQTDRQTDRGTERERQTDRQTDRQRQTDRETDRQTGRQAGRGGRVGIEQNALGGVPRFSWSRNSDQIVQLLYLFTACLESKKDLCLLKEWKDIQRHREKARTEGRKK